MAKKTYNTGASFAFFNAHSIESFDLTFEKIRLHAFNVLHRERLAYDEWSTILKLKASLKNAWDYDLNERNAAFYFRRWWLDKVVQEFGYMIWNRVYQKHVKEYEKTSVIPKTDLPRKQKSSIESVASYLADTAMKEFISHLV